MAHIDWHAERLKLEQKENFKALKKYIEKEEKWNPASIYIAELEAKLEKQSNKLKRYQELEKSFPDFLHIKD